MDFTKMTKRQLAEFLHPREEAVYSQYRGSVGGKEGSIRDTMRSPKAYLVDQAVTYAARQARYLRMIKETQA